MRADKTIISLDDHLIAPPWDPVLAAEGVAFTAAGVPFLCPKDPTPFGLPSVRSGHRNWFSSLVEEADLPCSISESFGIEYRQHMGVDRIILGSDYPHGDSSWPDTGGRTTGIPGDVPYDQVRGMAKLSARAVLGLALSVGVWRPALLAGEGSPCREDVNPT